MPHCWQSHVAAHLSISDCNTELYELVSNIRYKLTWIIIVCVSAQSDQSLSFPPEERLILAIHRAPIKYFGQIAQVHRLVRVFDGRPCQLAGLQILFKIGGPKWPMEQTMVGHFLKWWAQAYQTNYSWLLGCILYLHTDTDTCMHIYILTANYTVKTVLSGHWKKETNYHLMQVNSIAECSKGSILQYF